MKNKLRHFTDEHKLKISESRKRLKANGWVPYNKGGEYRKWYGNEDYVINFKNDGYELRNFLGYGERNPQFYFQEAISWTKRLARS